LQWSFASGPDLVLAARITVGDARRLVPITLFFGHPGCLCNLVGTRLFGRLRCVLPVRSLFRRRLGLRLLLFSAGLLPGTLRLLCVRTGRRLRRPAVLRLLRLPLLLVGRVAGSLRVGILPGALILLLGIRRRLFLLPVLARIRRLSALPGLFALRLVRSIALCLLVLLPVTTLFTGIRRLIVGQVVALMPCLLALIEQTPDQVAIVTGIGIPRLLLQGLFIGLDRLFEPPQPRQCIAPVVIAVRTVQRLQ
jgi:hypothetical protein